MTSAPAPRTTVRGSILVAVAAAGWGTWPFFLRHAEQYGRIPPALEAALAMGGLVLASALVVTRDRLAVRATPGQWGKIALLGVFDALNVVFFFAAYQRTSVAIAVLTHYLTPMLVALAAPLVVREPVRARTFVAVSISLVGLVLLLSPWSAARQPGDLPGGAFGLASAVCYATNVLVSKSLVPVFSGSEMALYHGLISVVLLVLLVPPAAWLAVDARAWGWLAVVRRRVCCSSGGSGWSTPRTRRTSLSSSLSSPPCRRASCWVSLSGSARCSAARSSSAERPWSSPPASAAATWRPCSAM
jgi:drug/metabolite transporter (DMT)-like permease